MARPHQAPRQTSPLHQPSPGDANELERWARRASRNVRFRFQQDEWLRRPLEELRAEAAAILRREKAAS
jgi:hypothetical protein